MEVVVVGAGAAGLAAADLLASQGLRVVLLEARDRLGGRMATIRSAGGERPIELGAEFIHGARNTTWDYIRRAGLENREVPDKHWLYSQGRLAERPELWKGMQEVFRGIGNEPDQTFTAYLDRRADVAKEIKTLSVEYVEGFHAADPGKVSTQSLFRSEKAAERDEGDRQFRLVGGYGALIDWFKTRLVQAGAQIRLNTNVRTIRWKRGAVEVDALAPTGSQLWVGRQLLITVPVGVLQKPPPEGLQFFPRLVAKEQAASGLSMGPVVKLILEFRSVFWPVADFGFIHAPGQPIPTWWSNQGHPCLTAWAGGPRAAELEEWDPGQLEHYAVSSLAELFKVEPSFVQKSLVAVHRHNWTDDPFATGAYSYTPVRMNGMAARLAEPVEHTLFFAGEATDSTGEQGTVHAALDSGHRAANEMLGALKSACAA